MKIRKGKITDVKNISKIYCETWKKAYINIIDNDFLKNLKEDAWQDSLKKGLEQEKIDIYVAELSKEIIGAIIVGHSRDKEILINKEIYALNVLPKFWGQRVGKKLLDVVESEEYAIYLKVASKNINARKFYERCNFKNSGIKKDVQIGENLVEHYIYVGERDE